MFDDKQGASFKGRSSRPARRSSSAGDIKQRIMLLATEMFLKKGYNGFSFLDLGKALGINHSLIHYHFGGKSDLLREVMDIFAESGIEYDRVIWTDRSTSLFEKIVECRDAMYRHALLFGDSGVYPSAYNILRLAVDPECLEPELREAIRRTQDKLESYITMGVQNAITRGELQRDAPVQFIMLQISNVLFAAGLSRRVGWEFGKLDEYFEAVTTTIWAAYGAPSQVALAWPALTLQSD